MKISYHAKPRFHRVNCHRVVWFSGMPWDCKKTLIFCLKKGMSRHPNSDQGIAMEFAWRSIAFLQSSCYQFSALSYHFHRAHNHWAFTAFALPVEDAMKSKMSHTIFMQTPRMTTGFAQWPLCLPAEFLICIIGDLTAWLWWPIALLMEGWVTVFVLSMLSKILINIPKTLFQPPKENLFIHARRLLKNLVNKQPRNLATNTLFIILKFNMLKGRQKSAQLRKKATISTFFLPSKQ